MKVNTRKKKPNNNMEVKKVTIDKASLVNYLYLEYCTDSYTFTSLSFQPLTLDAHIPTEVISCCGNTFNSAIPICLDNLRTY